MDFTLAGLRNRILTDKLDDPDYDTTVVDNFINDAHSEVFNKLRLSFQEKIFKGDVPVNSNMFQLPADLANLEHCSITGVPGFHRMKMEWRDFFAKFPDADTDTAGEPVAWTLFGDNIIFSRPTDKAYTMNMFYIKKAPTLTEGTSVPATPQEFAEVLLLGAYARVQERDGDLAEAQGTRARFTEQLFDVIEKYGERSIIGPMYVDNAFTSNRR